jgi:REP element-mobilizing transposase RayT
MSRARRIDHPDLWYHLTNRGLAKRTVFETREDCRYFLACVARAVRLGLIEVHAICLLANHFHMLARSPIGQLGEAMRRIEGNYARWFNRRRRRDGPLFRGRYWPGIIRSGAHWEAVVWYIDRNPVEAGLCATGRDYPYGSSRYLLGRRCPKWLTIGPAAEMLRCAADMGVEPPSGAGFRAIRNLVSDRLSDRDGPPDPLDDMIGASSEYVRDWMVRKAKLADGTVPGSRLADPETIRSLIAAHRAEAPDTLRREARVRRDPWVILETGMLRMVSGLDLSTIAAILGNPVSTVHTRMAHYRQALAENSAFADEAASIVAAALDRDFGFLSGAGAASLL